MFSDKTQPHNNASNVSAVNFEESRAVLHQKILSAVSHDLKTPLSSIIGSLEIHAQMRSQLTSDRQQALLDLALQEAYRLDSFITNILDIAKLENHLVKVRFEKLDLGLLLKEAVNRLQLRLKDRQLIVHDSAQPLEVETDGLLLSRCLQLLIDNAVVHGGGASNIEVRYGQEPTQSTFFVSISDQGLGIPENRMQNIFTKYARYNKTDQQNAGTGLGLTICQEIMQLMQGKITVANNPERGALFTIHLPIAAALNVLDPLHE